LSEFTLSEEENKVAAHGRARNVLSKELEVKNFTQKMTWDDRQNELSRQTLIVITYKRKNMVKVRWCNMIDEYSSGAHN